MPNLYYVEYYTVDADLADKLIDLSYHADKQEAMNTAKKWILEKTKDMNIMPCLSDIRVGKHHNGYTSRKYRRLVTDYFIDFFSSEKALPPKCSRDFEFGPEEYDSLNGTNVCKDDFSDFNCGCDVGCMVPECNFGDHLLLDSKFMTSPTTDGGYCLIKNDGGGFKFDIDTAWLSLYYADKSTKSLNLFAIYHILKECSLKYSASTQEDIRSEFRSSTYGNISTKTIGKQ